MNAMYLRKSRAEEQADTVDETLKRHRETLLEFAVKNHLAVREEDIYEEVVSGESLYARPEMLRLLANVEQGKYQAVLCMDIDRLGRGTMSDQGVILETFKTAGTKIITPRKIYDLNNDIDETYSEFESFMARQELKVIKRRMQRGIQRTIEDGGYLANAPYGYKRAWINKRPSLEIIEEEARFVRMMFDLYANQGYGCQRIADAVNALGAKPRRSSRFARVSVMKILKNPAYTGKIVWNQKSTVRKGARGNQKKISVSNPRDKWTITDGIHPPIIDPELYDKVQTVISQKSHPPSNTGRIENPLAGLVYCASCGSPMQRQVSRKGGAELLCRKKGCNVGSDLSLVEKAVVKGLMGKLTALSAKVDSGEATSPDQHASLLASIDKERKAARRQIDRLRDLLEQGVYPVEVYAARQKLLNDKLKKLSEAEKEVLGRMKKPDAKTQCTAIQNVLELYGSANSQERNRLLKSVVDKIVYSKEKGARPEEFHLDFFFLPFYL